MSLTTIKRILTLITLMMVFSSCTKTSIHLVRHADKIGSLDSLSIAGEHRAEALKQLLLEADIDVIYSSTYRRTQRTAEPLADALGISITLYHAGKIPDLVNDIKSNHIGKNILIVGHSNTVPQTINEFGVKPILSNIPEDVYNQIYQVILNGKKKAKLIKMEYGAQSP